MTATAPDVSALSFEQAVEELEKIVAALERGDVPLDRSIEIYERGEALKKHCETLLSAAENRIEIELAGGHRMRISGSYDPEALARLIRELTA